MILFANMKMFRLEGTEHMDKAYHQKWFHLKGGNIPGPGVRTDPGEALAITRSFGTKMGLRLKGIFSRITALPGIPTLMWKRMDRIAAKLSEGYEIKNLKVQMNSALWMWSVVRSMIRHWNLALRKLFR